MTALACPVDGAIVEIPVEWDQDTVVYDVLVRDRELNNAMWFAFHVRKEHGRDALLNLVERINRGDA